jgi:hypothetical protein
MRGVVTTRSVFPPTTAITPLRQPINTRSWTMSPERVVVLQSRLDGGHFKIVKRRASRRRLREYSAGRNNRNNNNQDGN